MTEEDGFTAKQVEVFAQVNQLLHEHFDAGLLIVETYPTDSDHHDIRALDYFGGMSRALGLSRRAFKILDREITKDNREE